MKTLLGLALVFLLASFATSALAQSTRFQPSPVNSVHGMFVQSATEIWLSDTFNNFGTPSFVYDSTGKKLSALPSGEQLAGISKHPARNEYLFSDVGGSKIFWTDAQGKILNTLNVLNPWNARWTPSGKTILVVTYGGSVVRIDEMGLSQEIITGLDVPFDVAPVGEDAFWVSEQGIKGEGRVCFYSLEINSGKFEKRVCNLGHVLDNPEGLWPLSDGSVAAVDTGLGTLVKIDQNGTTTLIEQNLGVVILIQVLSGGDWVAFTNQSSVGPALVFGNSLNLR